MPETPKFVPKDAEDGGWTQEMLEIILAWIDMIKEKQSNRDIIDVANGKKDPPNRLGGL